MSDNPVLFAIALTSGLLAAVLAAVVVLDNVAGIWREWRSPASGAATAAGAAMTNVDALLRQPVMYRECRCGHPSADHERECMYGWGNEADEQPPCDCQAFIHAWDVFADGTAFGMPR